MTLEPSHSSATNGQNEWSEIARSILLSFVAASSFACGDGRAPLAISPSGITSVQSDLHDVDLGALPTIAIRIPRSAACEWGNSEAIEDPRAVNLWGAIAEHGLASLPIQFQDVYSRAGDPLKLPCNAASPVIRAAALFFEFDEDIAPWVSRENDNEWRTDLSTDGVELVPTANGVEEFQTDKRGTSFSVIFGTKQNMLPVYARHARMFRDADGLSPFRTWVLDLRADHPRFSKLVNGARSMVLLFSLETTSLRRDQFLTSIPCCSAK